MKFNKRIKQARSKENQENAFVGNSIEDKVRMTMESGAPVEAISPMLYSERKEGVLPQTNIRTDKWDVAQQAMTTIADGTRQKREERLKNADKPKADSTPATGAEK